MIVMAGYGGTAILAGAAAIFAAISRQQGILAAKIAMLGSHYLVKPDGEGMYTALQCRGNVVAQSCLFSTQRPVLLGRIRISESKADFRLGRNPFIEEDQGTRTVVCSPVFHVNTLRVGFPEQVRLQSKIGTIVAHHLDLAEWKGAYISEMSVVPEKALPLLKGVGMQVNPCAEGYVIVNEWFASESVYIFGHLRWMGSGYEMVRPKKLPFVVTTLTPREFTEEIKEEASLARSCAKVLAAAAVALGTATYIIQHKVSRLV